MLKRLQYHINLKIQKLLDQMLAGTFLVLTFSLVFCVLYALTVNPLWLGLIWLSGLVYAVCYFIDALKFNEIVNDLDQDSLNRTIWISKAYFW